MMQTFLVALGAGATAALLHASIVSGAAIALVLIQIAPLPILIAAIGWNHLAGLLAAILAALGLGLAFGTPHLFTFLFGVGLPAWWLGYLALLGRPVATNGAGGGTEWYPVGRLVQWAAIIAALIVAVAILSFGTSKEAVETELRNALERMVRLVQNQRQIPAGTDIRPTIDLLVLVVPLAAVVFLTIFNTFNLWLAARIVSVSGRLRRPWPELSAIELPPFSPALLAAAIAGSFLPDLPGLFAGLLAASLFTVYAMTGFAVLHTITRGVGGRGFVLAAAYAVVFIMIWPILAMSLLGLAETAFGIRARFASTAAGPPAPRI